MAFQLLTGAEPFEADSLPGVMQHHLFTPVPDIRAAREGLPSTLVDLVNRALAKNPKERFGTTHEMLETIESIPYSDADHRESTEILQQLAHGAETIKVRTRSLPPLPEITVMIGGARRAATWRSLLGPWPLLATGFAALLAGLIWFWPGSGTNGVGADSIATRDVLARTSSAANKRAGARPEARRSAAPSESSTAQPKEPVGSGKIRLSTIPPIAEIRIDGRQVGVGSLYDYSLPAGSRRLTVVAPGYRNFDTTVTVRSGEIAILSRITLKPREGGS
jgi:serine/threonine protein kinase